MQDEQPTSLTGTTNKKVPTKPPPIPRDAAEPQAAKLCYVALERLRPDPDNLRQSYDDIEAFAEAIHADGGILQSLLVRPDGEGNFLIISGHRRFEAAKRLALKELPISVRDVSDEEKDALQISENINRSDVSAIELAQRLRRMVERLPKEDPQRVDKVAKRLSRTPNLVRQYLALLKLDVRVVKALERNRLGISQAKEVMKLARAEKVVEAVELATTMKSAPSKPASGGDQGAKPERGSARRVLDKRGEGFSLRVTFTSMPEAREATFRADLDKFIAAYGGAQ